MGPSAGGHIWAQLCVRTRKSPVSVALGDVNGDGALDVVTANEDSRDVTVLLGNRDGTLQAALAFGAGFRRQAVALEKGAVRIDPEACTATAISVKGLLARQDTFLRG